MAEKTLEQLKEELAAANSKNADLEKQNAALKGDVETSAAQIAELARAKDAKSESKDLVVKIEKKKYKLTFPRFVYKGVEYSREEASKKEDLLKELLEIGFGGLEPLND